MGTASKVMGVRRSGVAVVSPRRLAIAGLLLATLLLPPLTACQPGKTRPELPVVTEPPSNVVESSRKYAPVVDGIRKALEDQFPGIGWTAADPTSINSQPDGECILFLSDYQSDGNIVSVSDKFQKVMDAINPVLESNGFSTVAVLDEGSEGWWSVTSGNAQDANVRIYGRTWVTLSLRVPVESASCSDEELADLAP